METIQQIFEYLINLMNDLIYLLVGVALLGFLVGVLKYFKDASSPEGRNKAVNYMTYGVISLFVIVSVWGFVFMLGNTFNIDLKSRGDIFKNEGRSYDEGVDLDSTFRPLPPSETEGDSIYIQDSRRRGQDNPSDQDDFNLQNPNYNPGPSYSDRFEYEEVN